MQYMVMIYNTEATRKAFEGSEREAFEQAHRTVTEELRASGEFIDSHELSPADARVLRLEHARPTVTDGPVTEAEQWVRWIVLQDQDPDLIVRVGGHLSPPRQQ